MARYGVTYQDVAQTAIQLLGQGKNPTIEQIRLVLGTGSSTTLSQHLRQWKETQSATQKLASKEQLPEELISLIKGLWERMIGQTDEKIAALETTHQEKLSELEKQLQKYKTNNQRWQQIHNQVAEEKNRLSKEKMAAEKLALQELHEHTVLSQQHEILLLQFHEKQDRLTELQRMHKQSQENLEHFRESTRTQRLLDQQRNDNEKQDLRRKLQELNETHNKQKAQVNNLEDQLDGLETQHQTTLLKVDNFKKIHQEAEAKLSSQNKQVMELQTETRILASHLTQINQQLQAALDKNKQMEDDKWEIVKEKSRLEGELRQLSRAEEKQA